MDLPDVQARFTALAIEPNGRGIALVARRARPRIRA